MTRYLLIPATLLLCGCMLHRQPVVPEPARGPARDSLFQLDQTRGDSAARSRGGMFAMFASTAAYLRAGAPVIYGRDAAVRAVAGTNLDVDALAWEPLGGGVSDDLLAAYTYGVTIRTPAERPAAARAARYLAYWQRQRGHPWEIVAYVDLGAAPLPSGVVIADADATAPAEPSLAEPWSVSRTKIRSTDSSFSDLSYRMGTGYAFSSYVDDYGVVFGSPELRVGPRDVRDGFGKQSEASSLTWQPVYVGVAGSRDLGYSIGEYVSTGRGETGAAVQRFGKYLTIWRRQKNGAWKFVADGGNPSPAPVTK